MKPMPLYQFIEEHRDEIINITKRRIAQQTGRDLNTPEIIDSLPEFLDDIVAALRADAGLPRITPTTKDVKSARVHGEQRLQLGFTITELVHDYSSLCSAITDKAQEEGIGMAREYQVLNDALDVGIAASVERYAQERERLDAERKANVRLGMVTHELRNAASAALLAFDVIKRSKIGVLGQTGIILERNLHRLQHLIDRALTDVRLKEGLAPNCETLRLSLLLEDVVSSANIEAHSKGSHVAIQTDPTIMGSVDRQMLISAVSNLVQNGIKYSPQGSEVYVRSKHSDGGIDIEVEDKCGGIPDDTIGNLFSPFVQGGESKGLGMGLAITRQAIEAHGGRIHVENHPGKGCKFIIHLPPTCTQ